ncbi:MAG: Energy-coupling factor transporter ATP-binding protein EcfA1 [candidate division WS2 bacterium]|nr:Energy-coupling factor transporter ATP-binding protein EcfA1 [Candidatus Lithacetigena glycinireducens]
MLKLNNVYFSYHNDTPREIQVLRGVSLSLGKGEYISLVGNNGSGKSTLAKVISGLLKPTEGTVTWSSKENGCLKPSLRKRVGLILQNPDNQIVSGIVEEDVAFGLENLEIPPVEIKRKVEDTLRSLHLWDKKDYPTHLLSGGEKQKLAIASIVVMEPECLILDEATVLLDYRSKEQVLETIRFLKKTKGITIVQITSCIDEVIPSERVILLDKGKVCYDGHISPFLRDSEVMGLIGFDLPAYAAISQELIGMGFIKEICYTREELADKLLWEYQYRN